MYNLLLTSFDSRISLLGEKQNENETWSELKTKLRRGQVSPLRLKPRPPWHLQGYVGGRWATREGVLQQRMDELSQRDDDSSVTQILLFSLFHN